RRKARHFILISFRIIWISFRKALDSLPGKFGFPSSRWRLPRLKHGRRLASRLISIPTMGLWLLISGPRYRPGQAGSPLGLPEAKPGAPLAPDPPPDPAPAFAAARGARHHHQRQKVLLAWVALARGWRLVPSREPGVALGRRRLRGLVEPGVEGGRCGRVAV